MLWNVFKKNPLDVPELTKHSERVAFPRVCQLYVIGNDLNPRIEKLIEGRNGQGNLDYELFRIELPDESYELDFGEGK
ncbi:hypothetical protein RhiirA5_439934 [Rhizophagus irregularis]|uniref:Uncharacterized protein n=1 Tax=Rhizophagus irregularis TaxID=588596 RepID=A0A2N0NH95_9GLOM|nr:hypothetical protein RhiirA5_439934 [Rhizophagus irregularis]